MTELHAVGTARQDWLRSAGDAPARNPVPRTDARSVLRSRSLDRRLWQAPLVTSTFISKVAVPPFGAMGISVAIPVIVAATALGVAAGRLVVHRQRLLAYLFLMAYLAGIQVFMDNGFSPTSLLMLATLHLPYVFQFKRAPDHMQVLAYFQAVAIVIAGLGVLQYVVQFFVGPVYAFPFENFFPPQFQVGAFNMQAALEYASTTYRTNGVFMLEPSFFSQFLAVAAVVEIVTLRRPWVVVLMVVSMLLSYSGTGIALLGAALLFLAVTQRRWLLLAGLAAGLVGLVSMADYLADVPYIGLFLKRATEFTSQGSSGFERFIGGFYMFEQFLWGDPWRAFTGFGAGAFQQYVWQAHYPATAMAIFKMVFEFGVLGAAAYFAFLFGCLAFSTGPTALRLVIALSFLMNGSYVPFAHGLALSLLVWPALSKRDVLQPT